MTDYEIRNATEDGQPRIKPLADGTLSDGQTVSVDVEVKPRGEYTAGDAGENPDTIIEDIPSLAPKQICDQVALYAVEETRDAISDAEITVPTESVRWSHPSAISPDRLPGEGPWQVQSINYSDRKTTVELGNGQPAEDLIQQISDQTKQNSEWV